MRSWGGGVTVLGWEPTPSSPCEVARMSRDAGDERGVQFSIDLLYGILFVVAFGYLVFEFDPRVAAFAGGLVIGYFLHVYEKMSTFERVLREAVRGEAQRRVPREVEKQVGPSVERAVEAQVQPSVEAEVEARVGESVQAEVESHVSDLDERIEREVGDRVDEELEQIDQRIAETRRDRAAPERPPAGNGDDAS